MSTKQHVSGSRSIYQYRGAYDNSIKFKIYRHGFCEVLIDNKLYVHVRRPMSTVFKIKTTMWVHTCLTTQFTTSSISNFKIF
jgi:hypothetical protein